MSARVRVKICGITTEADARIAIEAGADALGFNLWPGSKRHIALDENAGWIAALPPFVTRVAVLVNAPLDEARRVAAHPAIDAVQFHGDETPEYLAEFAQLGRRFIVALRLKDPAGFSRKHSLPTRHVLLDAPVAGAYGGTGQALDLSLARVFIAQNADSQVILAGGLTPANVHAAIVATRPFGVDVASGVESAPGRKDAEKVRAFISEALS
ncbi:MAG: phosphoribosylanthranilate isomerase [Chthoniobacteraceae bacterium]